MIHEHRSLQDFRARVQPARLFALSTHGARRYDEEHYRSGDSFIFGPESRGLPRELLQALGSERVLRIPMLSESRSLNLANAAAVVVYEAWRQIGFSAGS